MCEFFFLFGALPHKFISEFDLRPLKFKLLPFATEIRDIVRPRSTVGSVKKNQDKTAHVRRFNSMTKQKQKK